MRRKYYRGHGRSIGRRRKSPETMFWTVIMGLLVLAGGAFLAHSTFFSAQNDPPSYETNQVLPTEVQLEERAEKPVWEPKEPDTHTNILLLGLDNQGMCDSAMIVTYDMQTFESAIISIQRDTFIGNQTWGNNNSGQNHLAWANQQGMGQDGDFHAGARLTAMTVENLLGIDLHAYATITFDGFVEMIDLIGGVIVEVAPEFALRDGTKIPTGRQRLNGNQALIYARHRQNPRIPEPGSESQHGDRVRRNQRLLKAILEQCKTLNSDELLNITNQLDNRLHTTLDDWDILDLANVLYNRDPKEIKSIILPGAGEMVYEDRIDREIYYYFLDFEATDTILEELGLK